MAREVRISIDDDEVFERMRTRKRELDLSWEEVLHRGLRREGTPQDEATDQVHGPERGSRMAPGGGPRYAPGSSPGHEGHGDSIGAVVEEITDQIRGQVRESLRTSMESMADPALEREMSELQAAEDAVLRFDDVVDEDAPYQVPLRVRLETSRRGLDIEVVAVREGKSVGEMNHFDRQTRRTINEHLARGGTAVLSFADGESYEVGPVLSWTHEDSHPTVKAVEIEEVLFDAE